MSLKYTMRYPISKNVREMDIKDAAKDWIEGSRWYRFTETSFPPEEKEGTLIQCGEGRTAWFKHFEFRKAEAGTETLYYGYRLETTDPDNRKWRAEAVFQMGQDQNWMYVSNACYINDINLPSKPMDGCRYPRIIRVMHEKDLLDKDHGLTIGQGHRVSLLENEEGELLQALMTKRSRLELPVLCLHVRGSQRWQELIETGAASYLARTAHVFLCLDEEDEKCWTRILEQCSWLPERNSGTDYKSGPEQLPEQEQLPLQEPASTQGSFFELLVPQNAFCQRIAFEEEEKDYALVDLIMDTIERIRPFQTADSPSWEWLHLQNTMLPPDTDGESYQLRMNEAMAARMQEARKQHRLTQGELAEKTGCSMILISRLERLQTRKVKRELIYEIEKALGLERSEIARLSTGKEERNAKKAVSVNPIAEEDRLTSVDDLSPADEPAARFCHMCGTSLKPKSRFCHRCGEQVV